MTMERLCGIGPAYLCLLVTLLESESSSKLKGELALKKTDGFLPWVLDSTTKD